MPPCLENYASDLENVGKVLIIQSETNPLIIFMPTFVNSSNAKHGFIYKRCDKMRIFVPAS